MSADRPAWPREKPDAATLIRYCIGEGEFALGITWGYVGVDPSDRLGISRYMHAISRMQHAHDVILALKALAVVGQQAADDLAGRIWGAAEAGDSYGEWLWEWAKVYGIVPVGEWVDVAHLLVAAERVASGAPVATSIAEGGQGGGDNGALQRYMGIALLRAADGAGT